MSDSNFRCPCGKSYLSYPALHTHIKRKHNGAAPGDLQMPQNKTKRGRPAIIMHKSLPSPQKNTDLSILTALQLAMLQVTDLYTHSCLLHKNQQPVFTYPNLHPCFSSSSKTPLLSSLAQFSRQFCIHFKSFLTEKVMRFVSCLMWWIEKQDGEFEVGMMEEFVGRGRREVEQERGVQWDGDGEKHQRLIKVVAVAISHWMYLEGFSQHTLELA